MSTEKKKGDFPTVFECIDSEHRTAKQAGLSKEEAIAFERKEFCKALHGSLQESDVLANESKRYSIFREYSESLILAINSVNAMYA